MTFLVPSDAWAIDAKFVAEDGTTDDHHGFGYHLPVSGSVAPEPPQHVIHVAPGYIYKRISSKSATLFTPK